MSTWQRYLLWLLLGIGLGYLSARLESTGRFQQWENLGAPPTGSFEIVDADGWRVFVKAKTDNVYVCSTLEKHACWTQISWPLDSPRFFALPLTEDIFWIAPPPGPVVDSTAVSGFGFEQIVETKYVLLADGNIWRWSFAMPHQLFQGLIYSYLGGLMGVILGTFYYYLQTRSTKQDEERFVV